MNAFTDWLTSTWLSQLIQTTSWAIPGIQTIHIICLAVLFISALMVTMRVLRRSWHEHSDGQVAAKFMPVIWTCLALLLVTGSLLITAEPGRTVFNTVFYAKVVFIALAVTLTLVVNGASRRGTIGGAHRAMAVLSMLLWGCTIIAGRYIAYN